MACGIHQQQEFTRSIEPARALAAEALKLQRPLSALAGQAFGLIRAELELSLLQAALRTSSWPGNPIAAPELIWKYSFLAAELV